MGGKRRGVREGHRQRGGGGREGEEERRRRRRRGVRFQCI